MIRRRRLGLVPVNPNPQPPGQQRLLQGAQNNGNGNGGTPWRPGAGGGHPGHNGNNGGGGPNGGGQGQGGGGGHPKPKPTIPPVTPTPDNPFPVPNYTPGQGQPDPRDATYYANLSRLLAGAQQGYSNIALDQSYSNTDYGRNRMTLALNQQQDTRSLAESALKSGLSSSGYLDRSSAEQTGQYVLKEGDLATSKYRSDAARQAARAALVQGFPMDVAAEYAAAADRYAQTQATTAQEGSPQITRHDLKALKKLMGKGKKHHHHGGH